MLTLSRHYLDFTQKAPKPVDFDVDVVAAVVVLVANVVVLALVVVIGHILYQ